MASSSLEHKRWRHTYSPPRRAILITDNAVILDGGVKSRSFVRSNSVHSGVTLSHHGRDFRHAPTVCGFFKVSSAFRERCTDPRHF